MSRLASALSFDESAFGVDQPSAPSNSGSATEADTRTLWNLARSSPSLSVGTQRETEGEESDATRAAARVARELSGAIPEEVKQQLYEEHGQLVEKSFVEDLLPQESNRLRYLRWQIDRLQDADIGDSLDRLDDLASLHKKIADEVSAFADHAAEIATQHSHPKRRRTR